LEPELSSYLIAAPEAVAAASADLSGIGEAIKESSSAMLPSTIGIAPAAADEVSAAIASLFSGHGQQFQALSAQAARFHSQFVSALRGAGSAYAAAEAANVGPLQAIVQAAQSVTVFSPVELLTGRPIVGNGANGTTVGGVGTAGGAGG
jgi:hypothetical protein